MHMKFSQNKQSYEDSFSKVRQKKLVGFRLGDHNVCNDHNEGNSVRLGDSTRKQAVFPAGSLWELISKLVVYFIFPS